MTPYEIDLAKALAGCSYPPGSHWKRFARSMADRAQYASEREISQRQRLFMEQMAWRFRRQLPQRFVPANKPPDLPQKTRPPKGLSALGKSGADSSQETLL